MKELETLVGNSYPNKYERSKISGAEDTISNILKYEPVAEIAEEFEEHKSKLNEGEKPDQELKAKLNEKLKEFGNVRISGQFSSSAARDGQSGVCAFVGRQKSFADLCSQTGRESDQQRHGKNH